MRDIELRLTADLDGATREVAGFTKEYGQLVKVVEKPLRQVNAFRDLETNVEKTGKAMRDARDSVRDLSAELVKAENPSRQLQENYKASVRELQRLERVEATQVSQLSQMGVALRAAGVDTQNLAAEQSRLSVEYGRALLAGRASQSLSGAKSSLGVTAVRDSQVELVKLREQYAVSGHRARYQLETWESHRITTAKRYRKPSPNSGSGARLTLLRRALCRR